MARYCENCGAPVEEYNKFCSECGTVLGPAESTYDVVEAETVDVVIEPPRKSGSAAFEFFNLRERLIGDKAEYYLPKFDRLEQTNGYFTWNWASFLFGPAWMMYRKMYKYGIAFWVLGILLGAMEAGFLSLVLMFAYGSLGNYLYMKDIGSRMETASGMSGAEQDAYIAKYGGASWGAVAMYYVLVVFGSSIVTALF